MISETLWRATCNRPCEVCGSGTKGCSANKDDSFFCRGAARDGWKCVKRGDDFSTYRREGDRGRLGNGKLPLAAPTQNPVNWTAMAEQFAKRLSDDKKQQLAELLGLPASALAAFPLLGYLEAKSPPCFTFSAFDADGEVVGINRRFVVAPPGASDKKAMKGSKRGLSVPDRWRDIPGPVLIPEGASDVLALTLCGLCAIGRPNNSGGTDQLARLLKGADREIVVFGENDKKDDGNWPGLEGEKVAGKLAAALDRPVRFFLPPGGVKDARVWVRRLGLVHRNDWAAVGRESLVQINSGRRAIEPQENLTTVKEAHKPNCGEMLVESLAGIAPNPSITWFPTGSPPA